MPLSDSATPPTLLTLLGEVGQDSGILRFHSSSGALDAIVELGQLTALRLGGKVKDLELSPLMLLEQSGEQGSGQFWPDRDYKERSRPSSAAWKVTELFVTLEDYRRDMEGGLKLPKEHDLFAALAQRVVNSGMPLEPPFEALWTRLYPLLEQGLDVGEMAGQLGLPIYGLSYALACLRREKVVQKLTPTLDFEFNLEGFGGFGN